MIKDIAIYFTTIMLEAIPFLLLGAILSAIIEEFVSEEQMAKIIPKNRVLGSLVGIFMGLFIPACDCAVIPVAMRLRKKKIPTNVIVSFMIASPIINPVVLFATYYAFLTTEKINILGIMMPKLFVYRTVLGVALALVIGIILELILKEDIAKEGNDESICSCNSNIKRKSFTISNVNIHKEHIHTCSCGHDHGKREAHTVKEHILNIINVTATDFLGILSYMCAGAFIASSMHVLIPYDTIQMVASNKYISTIFMMVFAYLISLCSTSDSFVAKTFAGTLSNNAILAFILLGPMIDVKNTIVLKKEFNKKFVYLYISIIAILILAVSVLIPV